MLLSAQTGLYVVYPLLVYDWEFFVTVIPAVALQGLILWECRHWIENKTMHLIHGLILSDTLIEGLLQPWARKPTRVNLYCVAAFALVIVLYRLFENRGKSS